MYMCVCVCSVCVYMCVLDTHMYVVCAGQVPLNSNLAPTNKMQGRLNTPKPCNVQFDACM
jgi:hypothetical protein